MRKMKIGKWEYENLVHIYIYRERDTHIYIYNQIKKFMQTIISPIYISNIFLHISGFSGVHAMLGLAV